MTQSERIIHIAGVQALEDGWLPFAVGDLVAGEALPLPLGDDGGTRIVERGGLWRHAGGELPYARPSSSELMYLLRGRVRVESEGGDAVEAEGGDLLIVPRGFVGSWNTIEPVLKISFSFSDGN